jgi:hypothetical protein
MQCALSRRIEFSIRSRSILIAKRGEVTRVRSLLGFGASDADAAWVLSLSAIGELPFVDG